MPRRCGCLVVLVLDTIALFVLADILPGFEIQTWAAALGMAAVLGVLNALVWPVLARFTLPLSVLTLGLSALVLNGALVALAALISPGVRVTFERLQELHPRLLPALIGHPSIAFVLARSAEGGAVALGAHGAHWLADGRIEGEDPLVPFGPWAADHVRRTDAYAHCPDLVLNSTYWAEEDEVAAFEELVGSHGGMGGAQGHPFVLFPGDLPYPDEFVVGPDAMHSVLRGWLAHVGHDVYA